MDIYTIIWILIPVAIIAAVFGFSKIKKRMSSKMEQQKAAIDQNKMNANIFVIEKKKDRLTNANVPKQVIEQLPKIFKFKKMPLVIAKVGPQVVTLVCEDDIYKKIPVRKNVNVDLAGIFIAEVKQVGQKGKGSSKSSKNKKKKKR